MSPLARHRVVRALAVLATLECLVGVGRVDHVRNEVPAGHGAPSAAGLAGERAVVGVNLGGALEKALVARPLPELQATVRAIAAAGITWMRIDIPFSGEEAPDGTFNWSTQPLVAEAVRDHLHVDGLISYAPPWAVERDGSPDPGAFARFAAAAAGHYAALGVTVWEVYNEPNLGGNWGGHVSAGEYARLLIATSRALRRVQPAATILAGGLAPAADALDGTSLAPLEFLDGVYRHGAGPFFDGVAVHPYTFPSLPRQAYDANGYLALPSLHRLMAAASDGSKRIWITESGAPTAGGGAVTPTAQAETLREVLASLRVWPWLGPVFVFSWRDDRVDGAFGLLDAGGRPKPAYGVVTRAARVTAPS